MSFLALYASLILLLTKELHLLQAKPVLRAGATNTTSAQIIVCKTAYQDTLWDTPTGHLTAGYFNADDPSTASSSLYSISIAAHPLGLGSWKDCADKAGVMHEIRISNAEYSGYGTKNAIIPTLTI